MNYNQFCNKKKTKSYTHIIIIHVKYIQFIIG